MTEDLNMTGDDYNIALLAFFITYILFEVPSNLVSWFFEGCLRLRRLMGSQVTAANQHNHPRS
jgi:hypothetical protein